MEGSPTGLTKKRHLMMVWKQTGRKPKELEDVVPPPEQFRYLWDWLCELPYPLSYTELEACNRMKGRRLARWQVHVMSELDKVRSHG